MRVALFVTCLADTLFPEAAKATVRVLERAGVDVAFPVEQTCCGQLHHNAGYARQAASLAERFAHVFAGYDAVVAPSGSCAAHVRAHLAELAAGSEMVAARTFELSQFLTGTLGAVDLGARWSGTVAYHPTCHSLRGLRLGDSPTRLLAAVEGLDLVELPGASECCGFGGTFAVKNHDVSTAMLDAKIASIEASGATSVCACDVSCLMHIGGGLERRGSPIRAVHLAEVLSS